MTMAWCGMCEVGINGCRKCAELQARTSDLLTQDALSHFKTDRRRSVVPEVGQVWDGTIFGWDEPGLVERVDDVVVEFQTSHGAIKIARISWAFGRMQLVGFQLPDGKRVMVGEVFENLTTCLSSRGEERLFTEKLTVTRILPGATVELSGGTRIPAESLLIQKFGWVRSMSVAAQGNDGKPPFVVTRGHHVPMTAEDFDRATLAFCSNCGLRVKDGRRPVSQLPCDPIQAGDRFSSAKSGVVLRAGRREGLAWRLSGPGGIEEVLLPSELAGDALGSRWQRLPRGEKPGGTVIHKVEISVSSNVTAGQVAREVLATLPVRRIILRREDGRLEPAFSYNGEGNPDRSKIDALLREDARQCPEFAAARRAALLGYVEGQEVARGRSVVLDGSELLAVLYACERYEGLRGGMWAPRPEATALMGSHADDLRAALGVYERCRSL